MIKIVILLLLQLSLAGSAYAEGGIEQNTISNYLQKAKQKARADGINANSLIHESSPYLLLHAYNPVNWFPWGEEAFQKARKENKPIFLSIGYSTCHWCHVMAHESFENKEIAALLNKYFISIKVDREQRPDIDAVYMSATQLINGHGGWPMSVFLDNRLRPFHAATYYPPFTVENNLGLKDVLLKLHELWLKKPALIDEVASSVTERIALSADETDASVALADNIQALAFKQIADSYDAEFGGFSAAPKFPRPGIFALLNRLSRTDSDHADQAKEMMHKTLQAMADGGINDQLGGGFHRYSVDHSWQVPHFEKMLYSQAMMVMAYSDQYEIEKHPDYRSTVYQTLQFVNSEMRSPGGGFYSALNADSEHLDSSGERAGGKAGERSEGAYYLWHQQQLKSILSSEEFQFIRDYFHIREHGNIDSDPQEEFTDLNIFYIDEDFRGIDLTAKQDKLLFSIKQKLNRTRLQRPRPHLDDKIITAWNGMMLTAFARASVVFDEPDFLKVARQNLVYIKNHLYEKDSGILYRQYRAGEPGAPATLSDYVWLIHGVLQVYDATHEEQWLSWANQLQENQDELFLDPSSLAYFESVAGDESLLFRFKTIYDGALPAANAIALANLKKLAALTEDEQQKKTRLSRATGLVNSFAAAVNRNPAAASMLLAVELR